MTEVDRRESTAPVAWREATIVFAIFTIVQVLDGVLTYWGVRMLGLGVEGNHLMATSMFAIGVPRALISAKLLACVCGYILYRTATHKPLAIATGLYMGVAVVPWLMILGGLLA
jgi:hypothetical protein